MQRLQSNWFKGIPDSEKQSFEELVRNSTILLGQLTKLIEGDIKDLESGEISSEAYDNPNWAYRQADRNGAIRALRNILKLTKLERTYQ